MKNNSEVRQWSLKVHKASIRSSHKAPRESSNKKASEVVLEEATESMMCVRSVLKDQAKIKKKDKEENKNDWGKYMAIIRA